MIGFDLQKKGRVGEGEIQEWKGCGERERGMDGDWEAKLSSITVTVLEKVSSSDIMHTSCNIIACIYKLDRFTALSPSLTAVQLFLQLSQIYYHNHMQDNGSISKLRECFNESTFFSTEVSSPSSRSQLNQDSARPIVRISSRFTEQPHLYLKKLRIKKKEASAKCLKALQGTVKAKLQLQRVQKDAAVSRYDFMRLYNTKKFRLDEQALLSNHRTDHQFNFKLSLERTKRQRVLNQLSLSARKEQQERNIQGLFQANKHDRNIFRETFRIKQEQERIRAQESAERIRKEQTGMQVRKKHLAELMTTKSKFNYLSKINQEMQFIKEYQHMVDALQSQQTGLSRYSKRQAQGRDTRFSSTFAGGFY